VSAPNERGRCGNCDREVSAAELDAAGWCAACRAEVVRRATVSAHVLGGVGGLLAGLWVIMVVQPGPRFVVVWLLLVAAIYFILYKLARRVAFEVFRARGVRPPEEE
jgi:hypothetical protein